ncbi:hypothetical protein ANN_24661 [Periplaneta americana]|uniref:Tc1-like transposase DDE domain-containing protein n=1 Tax=Periplaneta americana TaxID=6978 RepID=A0ABQ8S3Z3_PERAM|nr:hypothetical protein ANN_24661 [Periplaneta americana]
MAGLCEGGNEPAGSLKAICNPWSRQHKNFPRVITPVPLGHARNSPPPPPPPPPLPPPLFITSTKMPPIQSKLGAKTLHSQTREVVNNIHSFMKSEAASGDFLIPLKKVQERVSAATKVPERTIRKIIKEGKQCEEEGTSFGTPGKVHRVPKRITDFQENMLKVELYGLIKTHKPLHKTYVIDNLLAMNGHCVLRLPPYSSELNPLELIWADIKQWVAGQNTTFKLEQVMKLCQQRVDDISVEKWEKVCEHVEKIEDEYIEQEGIMENVIESFIITGGDSSSESDDDEDDHNENHDDNGGDISGIESLSDD